MVSEEDRFRRLQDAVTYHDGDTDSLGVRGQILSLYEGIRQVAPEDYTDELYSAVLPPSAVRANYSAAARYLPSDPVSNRTRWALQRTLLRYSLEYGHEEMVDRAQRSAEFSYQMHREAFWYANQARTIGRWAWAILARVNVPALGARIGGLWYAPLALTAALFFGLRHLAVHPSDVRGARLSGARAYTHVDARRNELGGRFLRWAIMKTNSPHGVESLPTYGRMLRRILDSEWPLSGGRTSTLPAGKRR